ncbi:heterokaryon incompatibility protein-domain-containing protein [Hypoxylon rubiginosum]|uniref:Heterokaryon incompatibility protein-domain-containing protein n=1 Tax=Hypoxylon rubiginosum TaxID=110542 RepID=A0ACC0D2B5_9PEZI|nr:heterokaryon incompatibility protein-domain-containing protein [Hypoxylon rubiginosum]
MYQYARLQASTAFRLLELLPGDDDATVSFCLHTKDLTVPPEYEAVSYAWGVVDRRVASICDKRQFMISPGLRDALIQMRYGNRTRLLWVDAICINQTNSVERGHQVSNMRSIYAKAKRVLVWLGKDVDGKGERAISALNEIATACLHQADPNGPTDLSELKSKQELWDSLPEKSLVGLRYDNADSWMSLTWLFSRPWLSRLWVIQEVHSNRDVQMLCGNTQVSWDVVALGASYIRRHSKIYLEWGFPESYYANAYYMRRRYWLDQVSLASLLNWGRSFDASDPLDRVYALIGMPSFARKQYPKPVDYSNPKVELYTDIAAWCITSTESLRVLYYSQHLEEAGEFPSWVPQWDRRARYEAIEDSLTKFRWHSAGDTKLHADIKPGSRVLRLTGIIFDVIQSQTPLGQTTWSPSQASWDHPVVEFSAKQKRRSTMYPTGESILDALSLTLAAGLDHRLRKASNNLSSFKADFAAYLSQLLRFLGCDYSFSEDVKGGGDWFNYETLVRRKCHNRSLLFTEKGYLGLGPDCQAGDVICLMLGSEVPFVLRPRNGYFQLVGDTYLHGIMEGEGMQCYRDGLLHETQFEIH